MFMDNKALLDQLMGKDRNALTFKGISEQWKDPSVCKHFLVDFCPYEILYNTKVSVGVCRNSHSDVVKQQFESSQDKEKETLARKFELDLLTQLERIVDIVENRVRKQDDRIRIHNSVELRLPAEKQQEIDDVHSQISISMRQVERLAEQGLLDDSAVLMSKVEELNKRAADLVNEAKSRYFKHETVCKVCGAVTVYCASGEDKDELINDHLGGRQHMGMERLRVKIIEIKSHRKLPLSRRDREFSPSLKLQDELRREGIEVVIPSQLVLAEGSADDETRRHCVRGDRALSKGSLARGRRLRSRSPRSRRSPSLRGRSPSTPRSMVSITFE
jgi:hypothetical protein